MVRALEICPQATQQPITCNDDVPVARLLETSQQTWLGRIMPLSFPRNGVGATWNEFQKLALESTKASINSDIERILRRLSQPSGVDAVLIEGLPHMDPGPPPADGARPTAKLPISEAVLVGLVRAAGLQIFGYLQEKNGKLIHEIAPELGKENTQSNYGRTLFSYHVDNACFSYRFQPEYLFLIGLINEEEVVTRLLRLEPDILPNIPSRLLNILRKPIFRFVVPQSFDFGGFVLASPLRPVIYGDAYGTQHIAWPSRSFRQDTQEAELAMREFQALLDTLVPQRIILKPGRVLAFCNSRVLHGRDPIPETAQRWLQRVYASRSLDAHRRATNSGATAQVFDARLLVMA